MKVNLRLGRKGLVAFWVATTFLVASYYNACGQVSFEQSSQARLNNMQETAQIIINNNAKFTNSELVDLALTSSQSDEVYVTNDPTCANGGKWEALNPNANWSLAQKNGQAKVYAKFRNTREGLETGCVDDDIIHDDVKPDVVVAPTVFTNVPTPIVPFVASDALSGIDKMICEWPGKAAEACNFSTSNGNLAEGRYLVKIGATDHAGNVSDPKIHDLMVDRTPPVITILSGPAALSNISNAAYTFNVTDNLSGVKNMECSWENNTSYAACATTISKTFADGAHKLFIRAYDNAGNMSEISNAFTVDATVPTVRILTGPPDFSKDSSATFTFDGNDDGVPLNRFECRLDGGAYAACTSPKAYTALAEGVHTFEVRGFDAVGNLSAPAARTWYVDLTAPRITFVKTPPALSNMVNAEFKYTIVETGSGIAKSECSLDNAAYVACPVDGINHAGLAAGPHTFQVRATDKAGNVGNSSVVSFVIDLTGPDVKFTRTPGAISKLAEFNFGFVATDAQGVDRVECRLDAGNFEPCDSVTEDRVAGLTNGNHQFAVRAYDKAGNVSAPVTYAWMVDLVPPVIEYFQLPPATLLLGAKLTLGFTVADTGSGVKSVGCTLDGAVVACQSGVKFESAIAVGTHKFVVNAEDNAGNTSMDERTIVVSAPVKKMQDIDIKVNPKVDVLVVMDNSGSMAGEMTNMATRMQNFLGQLNGLQWQLGIITTDVAANAALKDGRMVVLKDQPNKYLLDYTMPLATAQASFAATIKMPTDGSGNELGFKAAIRAMERSRDPATAVNAPNVSLFRDDAALAVIVVSDAYDNSGTTPENVIDKVKSYWPNKAFAFHSIVVPESVYTDPKASAVKAGDPCGSYRESVQFDGREYHRLSTLTGGIKGTVCSDDYGTQLKDMGKVTADLIKSVSLDCQPLDANSDGKVDAADVQVTSAGGAVITDFTVSGNKLTFNNALPTGINKFVYYCVN